MCVRHDVDVQQCNNTLAVVLPDVNAGTFPCTVCTIDICTGFVNDEVPFAGSLGHWRAAALKTHRFPPLRLQKGCVSRPILQLEGPHYCQGESCSPVNMHGFPTSRAAWTPVKSIRGFCPLCSKHFCYPLTLREAQTCVDNYSCMECARHCFTPIGKKRSNSMTYFEVVHQCSQCMKEVPQKLPFTGECMYLY